MENIDSVVAELQKDVKAIKIWIEKRGKRPDLLFREEWMDGRDVQLALSISTRTLRTLRTSGILIPTRLGKKYYYKTLAIKSLMEENYTRNQLKQVGRGERG